MTTTTEFGTLEPEVEKAVATASEPKIVGRAIYLELISEKNLKAGSNYITQVIITPSGTDDKGNLVLGAITYRSVSQYSPRSQWRTTFTSVPKEATTTKEKKEAISKQIQNVLLRFGKYGYTILRNNTPIITEITNLDLADVREWKAPASALRRITKARTSVGFPESLWG